MTETSFFWSGASIGDHGPYTDDQFSDIYWSLFTTKNDVQGVIAGHTNALLVSNPAGNTIRVASGMALVDGKVYSNSTNIDTSLVTPSLGNSRYDLVVLQKDWTLQTVRMVIVTGIENVSPGAPGVTQSNGSIWEIPLALVFIDDAAAITLTDLREYAHFSTPLVHRRQGGDADWTTPGSTDYIPALTTLQAGATLISLIGDADGVKTVTFPKAFDHIPIVLVTCNDPDYIAVVTSASATTATIAIKHRAAALATIDITVSWLAFGEIA